MAITFAPFKGLLGARSADRPTIDAPACIFSIFSRRAAGNRRGTRGRIIGSMSRLEPTRSQAFVIANVSDAPREVSRTTRTGELLGLVAPLAANLRGLRAQHEVLPPGRRSAPPHAHSTREELLFVVEGIPELWMDGAFHPLRPGDVVSFTAGTGIAHAIVNRSDRDAVLFVVATMPADDVCSYTSEG